MIYYTKAMFGRALKDRVQKDQDIISIGIWAHSIYLDCCAEVESDLLKVMLDLNTMELGPEFAISHNMLNQIADDLIAGKVVDLNSEKYREVDF